MPRVTSNVARLKRKNKVMKLAKGYWGGRSKLWTRPAPQERRLPPPLDHPHQRGRAPARAVL